MSDISTKLTYLNETKSQLKEMINYGLDDNNKITSSTTFREYVTSIFKAFLESLNNPSTLFTNLPKITGTGSNITLNDTANAPMKIELGASELSQDGTPTPSSPQDIHVVSGDNSIKVYGKNLVEAIITHANISAEGVIVYHHDYDIHIAKIVQGKTYTMTTTVANDKVLGFFINYPTINSTTYNNSRVIQSSYTFTAPITGYVAFRSATGYSTPMLNEGTTPLPYEPYVSQEADVNLGDIEYCKIRTYADRIFKNVSGDTDYSSEREDGAWYIKKNIGKVVLDGTENWQVYGTGTPNYFYYFTANLTTANTGLGMSNYYQYRSIGSSDTEPGISINGIYIRTRNASEDTIANYKSWLSLNNTELWYVLATPTYTKITGTLAEQLEKAYNQMLAYKGQTNISQVSNDLPFIITSTALKDLSSL